MEVSVPLRGLDMRKPFMNEKLKTAIDVVSVPLRGLDMRKPYLKYAANILMTGFSPLAGIRYAETPAV